MDWIWQIGLKKALLKGVQLALAYAVSWMVAHGAQVDPEAVRQTEVFVTGGLFTAFEFGRNFAKVKLGWKFL